MKRTLIALAIAGIGFSAPALAGPLEEQFFAMDTSRDGSISRAEFVAFQKERRGQQSRRQAPRRSGGGSFGGGGGGS